MCHFSPGKKENSKGNGGVSVKLSCDVINDLLPLYAEGMVSQDTRRLVEKHLDTCSNCTKQLEFLQKPSEISMDISAEPFKKIKRKLFRKNVELVAITVTLVLVIVIIGLAYITSPEYLSYSSDMMSLTEYEDGRIIVTFKEQVAGYDVEKIKAEDEAGYSYHLIAWNTTFNQYLLKNNIQSFILNPEGDEVVAVYYYSADGTEDILIYGKDQNENGGIITLPRLLLGYYFIIAAILATLCGIFLFTYRKEGKIRDVLEKVLVLSVSYLFSHIGIKGFKTTSYFVQRDLYAILLLMISICCLILLSINWFRKVKKMI